MTSSIKNTALVAGLALALAALPGAVAGQAQSEVPPDGPGPQERHPEAAEAINELWSPYCPGLMLEVCPSPGGAALRDSIQTMAEEGASSDEIVEWVLGNHGEEYRALPEARGTGFLAWVLPPVGLIVGLGVVLFVLWRMRLARQAASPTRVPESISEEEERRLREAMRELDAEEEALF